MTYVMGVDTSTTATKAILVDENGSIAGVAAATYGFETPQPLWSEQHPDLWVNATVEAIRTVLAETETPGEQVAAVGLTGQMHGMVLLAYDDKPIRPAILWNDQRTAAECDEIREVVGRRRLIEITGNDAMPGFTAPKVLWVRNNEPARYDLTRKLLLPKDYVRLHLTGVHATDRAGAAGTGLMDLAARDWSGEVIGSLRLPTEWFPATHEGTSITGRVNAYGAALTGLAAGTPVVGGGGDQAASAVGTGAVDPGVVTVSLGTSGVVFAATESPVFDAAGRVHAFPHAVPERWHMMGVMLSAAGSLRWLRDTVAPATSFDDLVGLAAPIEPGAEGVIFLPYLSGERTPHVDPLARGAFVGLTTRHGLGHLVRAVLEGVAFGLRDSLDLMIGAGVTRPEEVRITGGGARSDLWRQIVADVFDADTVMVTSSEGAAYGAAMLAAVGAGWADSAADLADRWVIETSRTKPAARSVARYAALHEIYRSLYPALQPAFNQLAAID